MLEFIFGIIGGTALLMYGVDLMGEGLENMSSSMMKRILEKFTGKLWKAFLAGIFWLFLNFLIFLVNLLIYVFAMICVFYILLIF